MTTTPGEERQEAPAPWIAAGLAVAGLIGAGTAYVTRGETGSDPATVAATSTPTPAASPSSSAPSPAPAATTGKLGKVIPVTLGGDWYTVTALRYARFDDGEATYGVVDARLCVDKANGKAITVSSGPWSLLYGESVMDVQISGGGLKNPQYPTGLGGGKGRAVQPGKCLRGWIHFELLGGKDPDAVEYSGKMPSGESFTFAWTV